MKPDFQMQQTDNPTLKKKKAVTRLKSRILDEVTVAMDNEVSNEEIIGTIETIKHQVSSIFIDKSKFKKQEQEEQLCGYR